MGATAPLVLATAPACPSHRCFTPSRCQCDPADAAAHREEAVHRAALLGILHRIYLPRFGYVPGGPKSAPTAEIVVRLEKKGWTKA